MTETATTSSATIRTILVAGATGQQGRALIKQAITTTEDIRIVALTRNEQSSAAQSLKSLSEKITVAQADLEDSSSVRKVFEDASSGGGKIWGVFVVLAFPGLGADGAGEQKQGITLVDIAHEFNVEHLIYSSAERGGESVDDQATLSRLAKVNIERHIKSLSGLRWTILRPAFFMENFDGTIGSITTTVLRCGLAKETKIQLIAASDIGCVALAVFQAPEKHASQVIVVEGDHLSPAEMNEVYKRVTGKDMPSIPNFLGKALISMNKHTKELITDIDRVYKVRQGMDQKAEDLIMICRGLYPDMHTFEAWVKERGVKKERKDKWNNVSIGELVRGKR